MALLSVGDKLGGRYFVITLCEDFDAAAMLEVRDAKGEQAWAQVLSASPLSPSALKTLSRELTAPVAGGAWRVPSEVLASPAGVAAAVYRQRPARALSDVLDDLAIDPFRREARGRLIGCFAALAESLGEAHATGATHGAISLAMVGVEGDSELRLLLSGVGVLATRRPPERLDREAARQDLAALVLALAAAMERARLNPEGKGVARWKLLLQCARAGDHPALGAARSLALALRDIAAVELDGPGGAGRERKPEVAEARAPVGSRSVPLAPAPAPREEPPGRARLRTALFAAGVVLAAGAALALNDIGRGSGGHAGPTRSPIRARRAANCGEESVSSPLFMYLRGPASELSVGCSADTLRLTMVVATDTSVVAGARQSRRGGAFEWVGTTVTTEAAALGSALSTSDGVWVAWLRGGEAPFGAARIDRRVEVSPAQMPAWPSGVFHGAYLLRADAQGAYIATTLTTASGPVILVVRAAFQGSEYPSVAFSLGPGEVIAVIPGDSATILVRDRRALHTLLVPVTALGAGASVAGDAPSSWAPTEVSMRSLPRSASLQLSSDGASAASEGAALPGGRAVFLVTDGGSQGGVLLAEFSGDGTARAVPLAERGRAESLVQTEAQGQSRAVALYLSGTQQRAVYVNPEGEAFSEGNVAIARAELPRLSLCGAEVWVAFVSGARAEALPLACVHER